MIFTALMDAKSHRKSCKGLADQEDDVEGRRSPASGVGACAMFLVLGMIGLPLGASLLVDGSVNIARTFGMSETVIGLTACCRRDIIARVGDHSRCRDPASGRCGAG